MSEERAWLESSGIRPRKRLGQNFLLDPRIPQMIVTRAGWEPHAPVLEIGPGGGALTRALLAAGHPVLCVEKDPALVQLLQRRFASQIAAGMLVVREGDALALGRGAIDEAARLRPAPAASPVRTHANRSTPVPGVDEGERWSVSSPVPRVDAGESGSVVRTPAPGVGGGEGGSVRTPAPGVVRVRPWVAGNLPYPITTPLLLWCYENAADLGGAVVMVQREYGDRLLAAVGTRTYSSITVWTRAHAEPRSLLRVGRSSFWPRPGVESVVMELRFPDPPPFQGDRRVLQTVLRASFGQRRKMLQNTVAAGLGIEKSVAVDLLEEAGCNPAARAETLDLDDFARLATVWSQRGGHAPEPP